MEARAACLVCSKQHDIWKCSKFKSLTHEEKWRVVRGGGLCTLIHRPTAGSGRDLNSGSSQRNNASQNSNISTTTAIADQHSQPIQVTAGSRDVTGAGNGNGISVAATGAGETRVCLEIIPVKVRGESNIRLLRHMPFLTMGEG